jgi:hypothetical protein
MNLPFVEPWKLAIGLKLSVVYIDDKTQVQKLPFANIRELRVLLTSSCRDYRPNYESNTFPLRLRQRLGALKDANFT